MFWIFEEYFHIWFFYGKTFFSFRIKSINQMISQSDSIFRLFVVVTHLSFLVVNTDINLTEDLWALIFVGKFHPRQSATWQSLHIKACDSSRVARGGYSCFFWFHLCLWGYIGYDKKRNINVAEILRVWMNRQIIIPNKPALKSGHKHKRVDFIISCTRLPPIFAIIIYLWVKTGRVSDTSSKIIQIFGYEHNYFVARTDIGSTRLIYIWIQTW